ncbi:trichohyalin-like [Ischnura elegans]|uniref:trichohyalin-like n=1 Tax=Ischnura elegans TaxID=197161 RepID=UPI001ED88DF8|nr:trichohyalin-like [Ischnura elegans]
MAPSRNASGRNNEKKFRKPPFTALLSYSNDKNMCKGAIEFQDECGSRKREPALFMNASYYCNLRNYSTDNDRKITEVIRKERLKDLENSKKLSKNWWDTIENLKIAKEKKKEDEKKQYEEESEKIFREMAIENRETERKILSDFKSTKFNAREDIKELHAACLLSEVLYEQAAILEFNKKIKVRKDEREKKYYERDMKAISEYFENEAKKAAERKKADLEHGRKLKAQMDTKNRTKYEFEEEERERERKFAALLQSFGPEEDPKQKKMEKIVKDLKDCERMHKIIEEEKKRDDEKLEEEIKHYHNSVAKLKETLKSKQNDKFLAMKEKADIAVAKLHVFEKKLVERAALERKCYERDSKKLAERQEQRALDDEKRQKRLAAEFLAANIQQRKEEEARLKDESLMKNLDRLRAMKVGEDCDKVKEVKESQEIKKKTVTRAILKEQMDSNEMRAKKEKEEARKYIEKILKDHRKEDEEVLAYGCSLVNKSKSKNRDVRPMQKLVKKFCERQKLNNE